MGLRKKKWNMLHARGFDPQNLSDSAQNATKLQLHFYSWSLWQPWLVPQGLRGSTIRGGYCHDPIWSHNHYLHSRPQTLYQLQLPPICSVTFPSAPLRYPFRLCSSFFGPYGLCPRMFSKCFSCLVTNGRMPLTHGNTLLLLSMFWKFAQALVVKLLPEIDMYFVSELFLYSCLCSIRSHMYFPVLQFEYYHSLFLRTLSFHPHHPQCSWYLQPSSDRLQNFNLTFWPWVLIYSR